MIAETLDRRVRKTRAKLRQCLGQLLVKKKIQDISVKEIAELADINRGTFYLHYRDVYDLLGKIEAETFQQFTEIISRHEPAQVKEDPEPLLIEILYLIRDNADLFQILMGRNGDMEFLSKLREEILKKIMHPWGDMLQNNREGELPYYYSYITEGALGMIKLWVENKTDLSPEKMASLIKHFIKEGVSWIP